MINEPINLSITLVFFHSCFPMAYVGPGIGAGVVAIVLGFFFSVCLTLFTVIYYPIKRFCKNRRKKLPELQDVVTED